MFVVTPPVFAHPEIYAVLLTPYALVKEQLTWMSVIWKKKTDTSCFILFCFGIFFFFFFFAFTSAGILANKSEEKKLCSQKDLK